MAPPNRLIVKVYNGDFKADPTKTFITGSVATNTGIVVYSNPPSTIQEGSQVYFVRDDAKQAFHHEDEKYHSVHEDDVLAKIFQHD